MFSLGRNGASGVLSGGLGARDNPFLTEAEKLSKSISESMLCMYRLNVGWAELPFFRCCGGRRRNQKYISVSTVRFKEGLDGGRIRITAVVTVVIEEESRRVRNLHVRKEVVKKCSGEVVKEEVSNVCSCDGPLGAASSSTSSCWHIRMMQSNMDFMKMVRDIVDSGVDEERYMYFGDIIEVEDVNRNGVLTVKNGGEMEGIDEENGMDKKGLIAIQMDQMSKGDLVRKGNRVAKVWSAWSVIDIRERLIVSVLWRPVLRGVESTRMNCVMCRHDICRKCRHEIVCEAESRLELKQTIDDDDDAQRESNRNEPGTSSEDYSEGSDVDGDGSNGHEALPDDGDGHMDRGIDQEFLNANGLELLPEQIRAAGFGYERTAINRTVDKNKRKIYYPIGLNRSFFFCTAEVKKAERLSDLIETNAANGGALAFGDPDGKRCWGVYLDERGGKARCDSLRKKSSSDVPRKVTLFTLGHGEFTILVLGWICPLCGFENHYSGEAHGIFPASKGVAYTVELMYWWIGEMCTNTRSFRAVYHSSRKMQQSASYNRRFRTGRLSTLPASNMPNRRVANDAIRKFIHSIDVDGPKVSTELFSCTKCETSMDQSDYVQLGLDQTEHAGKKRLKGVVIDAKVVPLLKDTERCSDEHDIVSGVTGLNTRIVRNRPTQNAIKMFFKACRGAIGRIRNRRASGEICESVEDKWFRIHDGYLYIRLGGIAKFGSTTAQRKLKNVTTSINIIRWFIDHEVCMCRGADRTDVRSHHLCAEERKKMSGVEGQRIASFAVRSLFELVNGDISSTGAENERTGLTEGDCAQQGEDDGECSDDEDFGADEAWVKCRHGEYSCIEEQLDTVLELLSFSLIEPVSLGFFPFHTEACTSGGTVAPGPAASTADTGTIATEQQCTAPVLSSLSANIGGSMDPSVITQLSADREVREMVKKLAVESTDLHKRIANSLMDLSTCVHGGRNKSQWVCEKCADLDGANIGAIQLQNSVLGRYVQEVVNNGKASTSFTRLFAGVTSAVLVARLAEFDKYLCNLSSKLHASSITYWKKYGSITARPMVDNMERQPTPIRSSSLYVFPGRAKVRQGIDFEKTDRQECTKNYFKGNSATPSFLTVQCACAHPKLLGFVVLKECESISAALSSVLTHFEVPPRRVWYDNGCNSYDCAITRIPWFLRWSMFMVDRFHFTGHTCSNIYNGDLKKELDEDRSTAAETINAIIDKGTSHITYLDGSNVLPFMRVLFAHLNATAAVKDKVGKGDIEDLDMAQLFREYFRCVCSTCERGADFAPWADVSVFTASNELVRLATELQCNEDDDVAE